MFELSKVFDLSKILALSNNLLKLKNYCTKIRLIRKTESLLSYESIFYVALRSCLLSFSAHRQHQISFRNGRITTIPQSGTTLYIDRTLNSLLPRTTPYMDGTLNSILPISGGMKQGLIIFELIIHHENCMGLASFPSIS